MHRMSHSLIQLFSYLFYYSVNNDVQYHPNAHVPDCIPMKSGKDKSQPSRQTYPAIQWFEIHHSIESIWHLKDVNPYICKGHAINNYFHIFCFICSFAFLTALCTLLTGMLVMRDTSRYVPCIEYNCNNS